MIAKALSIEEAQHLSLRLTEDNIGHQAIYQTVVALQAGRRSGTACTKSRAEVAGSGKKLWRQKGTGNARMGSRRSPIWRGGGVVWGPKPRDYSKKVNRKVQQLALRAGLTARIKDGDVLTVSEFNIPDGKTKSCLMALKGITDAKKVVVCGVFDKVTIRSAENLPSVKLIDATRLNVEHVLDCNKLLLTNAALTVLAARTSKS